MNSDVDHLYVQRKYGGRGLISAAFAIESEMRNLTYYIHHSECHGRCHGLTLCTVIFRSVVRRPRACSVVSNDCVAI